MKAAIRIPVVVLIVLVALGRPASSAAESFSLDPPVPFVLLMVAVLTADVVTLVGNTVHVAHGEGSHAMGWVGFAAGSFTALIALAGVSDADDKAPFIGLAAGGIAVAGMGIWSIRLAGNTADRHGKRSLTIGPELARRMDGTPEPRMAAAIGF